MRRWKLSKKPRLMIFPGRRNLRLLTRQTAQNTKQKRLPAEKLLKRSRSVCYKRSKLKKRKCRRK